MRSCAECIAFEPLDRNPDGPDPIGMCRRHAPHGAILGTLRAEPLGTRYVFPVVFANAWCMEWSPKSPSNYPWDDMP